MALRGTVLYHGARNVQCKNQSILLRTSVLTPEGLQTVTGSLPALKHFSDSLGVLQRRQFLVIFLQVWTFCLSLRKFLLIITGKLKEFAILDKT